MYDEFREVGDFIEIEEEPAKVKSVHRKKSSGLSPMQKFILSVLFFIAMFLIGSLCLLVTNKVILPIY